MQETGLEHALSAPPLALRTPPGACPDDLTSARFVSGTLDATARVQVTEHVSLCDPCLERIGAIATLDRVDESAPEPASAPLQPASGRRPPGSPLHRLRAPFAIAASLVLALFGALLLNGQLRPGTDFRELRSAGEPLAVPALRSPADGTAVRRADLRFEWAPIEGALYYELEILSADGDMLWQGRAIGTTEAPPASLYLEPGKTSYAWVRAYLSDGKTVKSPAVSFAILKED